MLWIESSQAFTALTAVGAKQLITIAQMDELNRCTIERVILTRYWKNGSVANNEIVEGLIVTEDQSASADYPDPQDFGQANAGWMNKQSWNFAVVDETTNQHGQAIKLDLRVRRKIRRGQVLVLIYDDSADDYDLVGLRARVLVKLA